MIDLPSEHTTQQFSSLNAISFDFNSSTLYRHSLLSGAATKVQLSAAPLSRESSCIELSKGFLFLTGGMGRRYSFGTARCHLIDTVREFSCFKLPDMISPRLIHFPVLYENYVYVIGGTHSDSVLRDCERYVIDEARWEAIPPLPETFNVVSVVTANECLYAAVGNERTHDSTGYFEKLLRLDLADLTWGVKRLALPMGFKTIAFFRADSSIYLVQERKLWRLNTDDCEATYIKDLPRGVRTRYCPAVLHGGILHVSRKDGQCDMIEVGSLAINSN
mmetsp:Transcript_16036/g.29386  ORF Transcript_16036/g.29386 Transcript_16036/m.29386 type:complete len:276 (+) Transcript_16036:249-1076(+)